VEIVKQIKSCQSSLNEWKTEQFTKDSDVLGETLHTIRLLDSYHLITEDDEIKV
jgi:hypothetical protein